MCREIEKILDEVKRRIVPRFNPQRIILFGSYAGGQPGPDSDLDLLIVMEVEGSTRQKANEIDMLLADRSIPMDFIVLTPEQYERQKKMVGSIARQIEQEGKVIYEHAA
jgi:predicted nucleotidyltransferase